MIFSAVSGALPSVFSEFCSILRHHTSVHFRRSSFIPEQSLGQHDWKGDPHQVRLATQQTKSYCIGFHTVQILVSFQQVSLFFHGFQKCAVLPVLCLPPTMTRQGPPPSSFNQHPLVNLPLTMPAFHTELHLPQPPHPWQPNCRPRNANKLPPPLAVSSCWNFTAWWA